jgi:hypothetical protein
LLNRQGLEPRHAIPKDAGVGELLGLIREFFVGIRARLRTVAVIDGGRVVGVRGGSVGLLARREGDTSIGWPAGCGRPTRRSRSTP